MVKKKLLFVIPSLSAGGAEKSLVNLLSTLDASRYLVDLFMFSHEGLFRNQLPEWVRILPKNTELHDFQKPLLSSFLSFIKKGKFLLAKSRLQFFLKNQFIQNKGIAEQYSWPYLRNVCTTLPDEYDAAIGFLEKSSNYFVVDRVRAKNKIAFIHTSYSELHLDTVFDAKYFSAVNKVAVVSEDCSNNFKGVFPEFSEKVVVMPNIVSSRMINKLAMEPLEDANPITVISVGRLEKVKGFDLAIEAARILKDKNISFNWSIIGEGSERDFLQQMIDRYQLQHHVSLIGLRDNPYPYINAAKVFVQSSRYEGKSIAVDEAKILAKPIVLTNFSTAKDQIEQSVNGLIVEMTPEAIAEGILKYLEDSSFAEKVSAQLASGNYGTEQEIEKFYQLINE